MERHIIPTSANPSLGPAPKKCTVGIKISREFAVCWEGQLLLWMTCNLVGRLKHVITGTEICIPRGTQTLMPRFVPFGHFSRDLRNALSDALELCSRGCSVTFSDDDLHQSHDIVILVGHDATTRAKAKFVKNVACNGWLARVGDAEDLRDMPYSTGRNPFGACAAACLIVGEVFKFARKMDRNKGEMIGSLCLSTYDLKCRTGTDGLKNPPMDELVNLGRLQVVGSGAVAHGLCQAIFPIDDLSGDLLFLDRSKDPNHTDETIESTNLARYIMAANPDEGRPKSELLAERMSHTGIRTDYSDDGLEAYVNNQQEWFSHVVSCVDNNEARHVIQDRIPDIIHGGSTLDMMVQVSVFDLSCAGCQCLKCFNDKRNGPGDDEIREQLVNRPAEQRKELARKNGISYEEMEQDLDSPCGSLSDKYALLFSEYVGGPEFSVNFVSVLTGILLAAEVVKGTSNSLKPTLDGRTHTDMYYSFLTNTSNLRRTEPRQGCWCESGKTTPRDIHANRWPRSQQPSSRAEIHGSDTLQTGQA